MNQLTPEDQGSSDGLADYIVVGGGSAGCVVASRLSADVNVRVVLIEAGADFAPGDEPVLSRDARARAFFAQEYFWPDLLVEVMSAKSNEAHGRMFPLQQGRIMGGGSSINGMHAQRGLQRDYEEWLALGVEGWGPQDVLPFFKRLENDVDFRGGQHGESGPIRIERVHDDNWSALSHATRAALERKGVGRIVDMNVEQSDGCGPVPLNISSSERISAARGYLTAEVRRRPNLQILPNTVVTRLSFTGHRVVGVECEGPQGHRSLRSRQTIVCCGALQSPALLLRSGVGPGAQLQKLGLPVVADRPGVGENLLNHPYISVSAHIRPRGRRSKAVLPPCAMIARFSSGLPECPATDLMLNVWERVPGPLKWDPLCRQIADFMVLLSKPFSKGSVSLNPERPSATPVVRFNALSDPRDHARMVRGVQVVAELLREPTLSHLINQAFVIKPSPAMFRLLHDTVSAAAFSAVASLALDGPSWLRRRLLRDATIPLEGALDEQGAASAFVADQVMLGGHPAGTCRMGRTDDAYAVTDSRCRVIGVEGLYVVDTSIFPTLMTAGTNLPAIMAGEKASAMIREDRQRSRARVPAVAI